ncbi:MAG: SDR family NAD(P)-dependent oxidoreductase [Comamonadaceae bacterium]|nr:MAG: SDR family NAD(P)-dependent oxidoreductase [Comamonadaceae bacterium]
MQIKGSTAVVTGAASGLGQATVRMLIAAGARVAAIDLSASTSQAIVPAHGHASAQMSGQTPAQSAEQKERPLFPNDSLLHLDADVSDAVAMEAAFARATAAFGTPTILVNCAGVLGPARVFRIDKKSGKPVPRALESFQRVIDINLVGTFNAVRLFAEGIAARTPKAQTPKEGAEEEGGVIINTASVAAYEALSGQAAYGSSKAGVASMTLPLARELARFGIRVMAIAPGTFATGMYLDIPENTRRALVADVPFPPRAGRPDEFAHMVRALIENEMMNGSVVRIDGAVRMREPVRSATEGTAI